MNPPTHSPSDTLWQFRFLICRDRMAGQQMVTLGGSKRRRTQFDEFHGCQSYVCDDYTEFETLLKTVVAKTDKSFWGTVELHNPATGDRRKLESGMQIILLPTSQDGKAVNSPGSYPGVEGSIPSPATIPEGERLALTLIEQIRLAVQAANLTDPDWTDAILAMIPDAQTRDYLQAQTQQLGDSLSSASTLYQETFLECIERAHEHPYLSQTPGGSQSGGGVVEAPLEPEGTLSEPDVETGEQGDVESPEPAPAAVEPPVDSKPSPKAAASPKKTTKAKKAKK